MPHGQSAQRIAGMGGPIVDRCRFELIEPLVVVAAVMLQRFQPRFGLLRIEPTPRKQQPHGVNAFLHFLPQS